MPRSAKPGRRRSRSPRRPRSSSNAGGGGSNSGGRGRRAHASGGAGGGGSASSGPGLSGPFRSFLQAAGLTAAAKATSGLGRGDGSTDAAGVPGEFGLYLFAQSWAPRFCCTNGKQCRAGGMAGVEDLSPHGLWPAYHEAQKGSGGRTYPQFCTAPSTTDRAATNGRRERHEWEKHGTCTGLGSAAAYFAEEAALTDCDELAGCRDLLEDSAGGPLAVGELLAELGGERRAAVMSDKVCRLVELTTCWCVQWYTRSNYASAATVGCNT